jgi:hypothetical protein
MPGYALLPTVEEPTSHLSLRLSNEDMAERNEWMREAQARGMSIPEIAYEVGLSLPRVYQILKSADAKKGKQKQTKMATISSGGNPKTPRDHALIDFWNNDAHPTCANLKDPYAICHKCFGQANIIESEYDSSGWPYEWAMLDQEKYIEACS